MQLIIAYLQPERFPDVKQELYRSEVYKISAVVARGCGRQRGRKDSCRGLQTEVDLLPKLRVEIAVNEWFAQPTVDALCAGARTGAVGDGKIFAVPIFDCIRIRTGETGAKAIG